MPERKFIIKEIRRENSQFFVSLELYEDNTLIETRNYGLALSMTEEEIQQEMERNARGFFTDRDNAIIEVEREKQKEAQDKIAGALSNKETIL